VGHELRQPLNVLKTSLYYLRTAKGGNHDKVAEHHQRIDRNFEVAEVMLRELSEFAALPAPELGAFSVEDLVHESLDYEPLGNGIRVEREFPVLPPAQGDRVQIRQVFVRLLRRANYNMHGNGQLLIRARDAQDRIEVDLRDTGPNLSPPSFSAQFLFQPAVLMFAGGRLVFSCVASMGNQRTSSG